jgi:uncharacterized iron-regulated membrane protein
MRVCESMPSSIVSSKAPFGESSMLRSGGCSWLTRRRRAGINVHRGRCELSESDTALRTLLLLLLPTLLPLPLLLPPLPLLPLLTLLLLLPLPLLPPLLLMLLHRVEDGRSRALGARRRIPASMSASGLGRLRRAMSRQVFAR